jgi:hypothetical protein
MPAQKLKVGTHVVVPWGLGEVHGEILEVWGDPAQHVRVRLHLSESSEPDEFGDADEADEDVVVVLSAEVVEARPLV